MGYYPMISRFRKWLYFTLAGRKAKFNNVVRYLCRAGKRGEQIEKPESQATVAAAVAPLPSRRGRGVGMWDWTRCGRDTAQRRLGCGKCNIVTRRDKASSREL